MSIKPSKATGRLCVYLRQVIEFYYNHCLMPVKPYNPVKPVNSVKRIAMTTIPILEKDAPLIQNKWGQMSKLEIGDAVTIGERHYVIVRNDHFDFFDKKVEPKKETNPYKEFYLKKTRHFR